MAMQRFYRMFAFEISNVTARQSRQHISINRRLYAEFPTWQPLVESLHKTAKYRAICVLSIYVIERYYAFFRLPG